MTCGTDAYAVAAPWYDALTARALRRARSRITSLCLERGWRKVLDIGCGTGLQVKELHASGIVCCGLDASPAMLAVARKRLPPDVELVQGDSLLSFVDNAFDAAILSLILHETDDEPEALLRDALRVAPACIVLEWRMPERNLDLPGQLITHAVERLAGKRHYARFRAYAAKGWLRGLAARAGTAIRREEALCGGLLTLAVIGSA